MTFKWHLDQVARALSRLLNAATGGEGDTTYSAGSWSLALAGSARGKLRVAYLDWRHGAGHCERAWEWHREHGLLTLETSSVD